MSGGLREGEKQVTWLCPCINSWCCIPWILYEVLFPLFRKQKAELENVRQESQRWSKVCNFNYLFIHLFIYLLGGKLWLGKKKQQLNEIYVYKIMWDRKKEERMIVHCLCLWRSWGWEESYNNTYQIQSKKKRGLLIHLVPSGAVELLAWGCCRC